MARKRLSMRKIAEVLRLKHEAGLNQRQIARSSGISRPTVAKYLEHAAQAGLGWPLPEDLDEEQLQALLFPPPEEAASPSRVLPDMEYIHTELRRRYVTLQLLWEEYRSEHPSGYGYTQFCEHYKRWKAPLEVTLRQRHVAGEKTFLDWAGKTLAWSDPDTGERQPVYLFVAVLGASDYVFAEAFADQQLDAWIDAHVHAAEFYGGVTRLWIPDNPRTGVDKACYYEPRIHASYQELADHYEVAILPTRTAAPRDKAKVENSVLIAERRILARLRNQTFFSLAELNAAVRTCVEQINRRPFQKMSGCRLDLYKQLDQPLLRPLPARPYELGKWSQAKANIDYHVQVDWHMYSVPYTLTGQRLEVRLGARTVEIFDKGRRVAAHRRSHQRGGFTTDPSHRPKSHQKHLDWTPQRLVDWAATIGPQCARVVGNILQDKPHPEQGYRACLGIMRLARGYGHERMEAACHRAVSLDACSYRSIQSILKTKLDQQPLPGQDPDREMPPAAHDNIRGEVYYQTREDAAAPG